jgi:hypothetical protein
MHLLASGDEYKFRAFQVRAKFVLWARLSPKVGFEEISAKPVSGPRAIFTTSRP